MSEIDNMGSLRIGGTVIHNTVVVVVRLSVHLHSKLGLSPRDS